MEPENMEPENTEPEHETLLRQRSNGSPQKNGKGKKGLLLLIVIILALGGAYAFMKFNKTSDAKKVKQETSSTSAPKRKKVDPEIEILQVALDKLGKLFVDGNAEQYRTDVTDKEFEDVQKSIKQIKDKDLKKELSDKLEDVKKSQGQGLNQSQIDEPVTE